MKNINVHATSKTIQKSKCNYLFRVIALLLCFRHILLLLGAGWLATLLFRTVYVLEFLFLFNSILNASARKWSTWNSITLVITLACIIYVAISVLLNHIAYLEQAITYFLVFPLLSCSDSIEISKRDADVFFYSLIGIAIFLIIAIFIPANYEDGTLVLYTPNGNQSGLLYMSAFLGVYAFLTINKARPIYWFILIGLLYGCSATESRTSLAACFIALFLGIVLKSKPSWSKIILACSLIVFVAFPFTVDLILTILNKFNVATNIFSGREQIWSVVINGLIKSPLSLKLGVGIAQHQSTELGAHNVLLDIAWKYSLPIAILFLASLLLLSRKLINAKHTRHLGLVCLVCGLVHMTFEAALISGALDYSLYFLFSILGIMTYERIGVENEK